MANTERKLWAAVTVSENGKHYAYAVPFTSRDNVLCKLEIKNILHANIYRTKKETAQVVEFWNKCYKENGTYMF